MKKNTGNQKWDGKIKLFGDGLTQFRKFGGRFVGVSEGGCRSSGPEGGLNETLVLF